MVFIFSLCWSVLKPLCLYLNDVYSDLLLSIQYFGNGDVNWGTVTLIFFAVPFLIFTLLSVRRYRYVDKKMIPISIIFGFPNALLVEAEVIEVNAKKAEEKAVKEAAAQPKEAARIRREAAEAEKEAEEDAQSLKKMALAARLFEIVFESLPQLCLQLYIAGHQNLIPVGVFQIGSIVSSVISIVSGLINGLINGTEMERFQSTIKRNALYYNPA